ncbi:LysR family transcriptional regulator [Cocleimonas sp. KMM 6892]|uniref:LysR family transcriptional regulator n=1 Tax=unclassified Cocleimonas TaxID=2639732 RepID=UPI002DBA49A4|nr:MULTISPECIES: LysR family transcriptional regulator [unclassified Cocleimonas]MEB8431712.1 LysR family transcriptional regulator [Cocleimonas sp. KMM 6892]MEC4715202.1 LysR family transcriptional regulator [Cocleimonas sp. KMM 6895]MEC4743984.1 LysR family transcriptional regulator [Cocleimonas sp. KMM 6896]
MPVSPPRPKGPPLNALRAFEAAARLGGFNNAAEELCVTSGAISQHIKTLEDWAGAKLFERRSQGVVLTDVGTEVIADFTSAFDALGDAVRLLRTKTTVATINIAALPSIAQLWLSPRLPAIRRAFPHINISITALENPPNLNREMFDISLFFEAANTDSSANNINDNNNNNQIILEEDTILPVCSPEIAKRLKTPADLLNETCLYDVLWPDDWTNWLNKAAPDLTIPKNGPSYSLFSIAAEETKNGAGILMGHLSLLEAPLKNGDLVAPFKQTVTTDKPLILKFAGDKNVSNNLRHVIDSLTG